MKTMAGRVLILLVVFVFVVVVQSGSRFYTAEDVYNNILKGEDRHYFLRYYLGKGYMQATNSDENAERRALRFPQELNIPEENLKTIEKYPLYARKFPGHFFTKFITKYQLASSQGLKIAKGDQICFPNGDCIDSDDSGTICCT